jgi:cytoskeletal protein RodZ
MTNIPKDNSFKILLIVLIIAVFFTAWWYLFYKIDTPTDEKKPSTNEKKPSTNEKKPSTNEKKPSTNEKKPSTNEKKPSTDTDTNTDTTSTVPNKLGSIIVNNLIIRDSSGKTITIKKNGDDLDLGSSVKANTYRMGCDRGKYLGCWGGVFYLKNNKNGLQHI